VPRVRDHGPMEVPRRLQDRRQGDWINERLLDHDGHGVRVASVVPTGFARVVRVLHPAGGTSWAETARANSTVVHPLVQWGGVNPAFDGRGRSSDHDPEEGSVPGAVLVAILEHCPAEGEVYYGVWDGFGIWSESAEESSLMPGWGGRSYRLFAGAKSAFTQWPGMNSWRPQSANLIWPKDHSWCIATEIDWDSTLIACADQVATAILADRRLEGFDVKPDDDLSWGGDRVNPRPSWLA
jgi:hypothetical protein